MFSRMKVARKFLLTGVALIGLLAFAAPRAAAAQSCALCYTRRLPPGAG